MKILLLTDKTRQFNGYAIVAEGLRKSWTREWGCVVDCFGTDEYREIRFKPTAMKSTAFSKFGLTVIAWDFLLLLWCTRGKRYDVIHCNAEHFALVAAIYGWLKGVPFTVTAHGTYGALLPHRHALFRWAFKRASGLIAVSRYTRARMQSEGITRSILVIPNGVDHQHFNPVIGAVKRAQLLFVGNDRPRKGFQFLYRALVMLAQKNIHPRLVVAGNFGDSQAAVAAEAQRDQVDLVFAGKVSEQKLLDLYRESVLNVLPSHSEPFYFEGFGLVHVEAIASGTLTVGCLESGNEDAIHPGNGWLVRHGDVEALARVIEQVLCESERKDWFPSGPPPQSWRTIAEAYINVFRSVCVSQSSSRG
jgi:glycosyltransferase involved in cell wall biosynthesis